MTINDEGYINLSDTNPFQNNVAINFTSGIGWIKTQNLKGILIESNHLSQITVNGQPSVYKSNLRLDNYYLNGTVIRSNDLATTPLKIYDEVNLQGASASLSLNIIEQA